MSNSDEVTAEPEATEELITPLRNRPWKYIPQFTDEECRLLRVERTSEEEEGADRDEGEGLLQYYRHNRTLETDLLDDDMNGDLEVVELAKVVYGRASALADEHREEVQEEQIVPVRIVRNTEVEFGKEMEADGVEEPKGESIPEPDGTWKGADEPLTEEHQWEAFSVPSAHMEPTYLEPTHPKLSGNEGFPEPTMTSFPPESFNDAPKLSNEFDDLETRHDNHHVDLVNNSGSDLLSRSNEVKPVQVEYDCGECYPENSLLAEWKYPGQLEGAADPELEGNEPRTEVVEETLVETKTVQQTRPFPVFTYTSDGVENGSEGALLAEVETETHETIQVTEVSEGVGNGNEGAFPAEAETFETIQVPETSTSYETSFSDHSVIQSPPEKEIQAHNDALLSIGAEEVRVSPGRKGGTLPPPGAKNPPEKPPRARRTKSETFFGFIRRKSKSKEREEEVEKTKEPEKGRPEGEKSHSARTTPTTKRSKDTKTEEGKKSTQPSKPSFFQRFGFGRSSKKAEKKTDQRNSPDEEEEEQKRREVIEGNPKNVEIAKAATLPKQSSGKTNIRIFEIMAKNDSESTPDITQSSHQTETSAGSEINAQSQPSGSQSGFGNPMEAPLRVPHTTPDAGYVATEPHRNVLYDGNRTAESEGDVRRVEVHTAAVGSLKASAETTGPGDSLSDIFAKRSYIVAVAIDFGTAFSGYAFCFLRDPESVHMMGRWEDGDPGLINQKTPTTLLLTPDAEFHSFGFTARNNYHDLSGEEAKKWLYFDRFKMALYESQDFSETMTIEAANGSRFSGLEAISMTLRFFKDHALRQISSQSETQILNDDVLWIVTVPAIWNASAKQLMRLAAYKAEIVSPERPDQLQIALEPEAASVHIRRLQLRHLVPEKPIVRPLSIREEHVDPADLEFLASKFNHVVRYMVVDCGGGTVDITVHEMNFMNRRLQELHVATGGPHGSFSIDRDFERLLGAIFGDDFVQSYKRERPSGWVGLTMAFESRKRAADPRRTNPLNVALPFSFIEYHRKTKGSTVEQAIRANADSGVRWSSQGMLRLTQETMKKLFDRTLSRIKDAIDNVLSAVKGIDYIFLVGGLSESSVFQCDIREHYNDRVKKVVIPQEANLAVIKGALAFGLDPTVIAVRRSKLTYGAAVLNRFVPGKHPKSKLVAKDGVEWCRDVFDIFVSAGEVVRAGESVVRQYIPAATTQKRIVIGIYCTEDRNPGYVSDPAVRKCANVSLDLVTNTTPSEPAVLSTRRRIQAELVFAETEIKVTATDTVTGRKVNASIDFLNV